MPIDNQFFSCPEMSGDTDYEGAKQAWLREERKKRENPVRVAAPRTNWVLPGGFMMISNAGSSYKGPRYNYNGPHKK